MEVTFQLIDKLDPIAIYAAVVSTTVLFWELWKWRQDRPRLRGTANPNMMEFGPGGKGEETFIFVEVNNIGSKPTTVTNLCVLRYKNLWRRIRGKTDFSGVVNSNPSYFQIPGVLEVGARFTGRCIQNDELVRLSKEGMLYMALYHSFSTKPLLMRVPRIIESDQVEKRGSSDVE